MSAALAAKNSRIKALRTGMREPGYGKMQISHFRFAG
jgi:hypothetical protein